MRVCTLVPGVSPHTDPSYHTRLIPSPQYDLPRKIDGRRDFTPQEPALLRRALFALVLAPIVAEISIAELASRNAQHVIFLMMDSEPRPTGWTLFCLMT